MVKENILFSILVFVCHAFQYICIHTYLIRLQFSTFIISLIHLFGTIYDQVLCTCFMFSQHINI